MIDDFDPYDADHIDVVPFSVWPLDGGEAAARAYRAANAKQAAEKRARDDYGGDPSWKQAYCVRDGATGRLWQIVVGVVEQPSFVAATAQEIPMPPATHVMWGGRVLCEDLRLRGVPRDWPAGQRWISLKEVADGAAAPPDRCEACWSKAPILVDGIR
jgi:hypothetical protein